MPSRFSNYRGQIFWPEILTLSGMNLNQRFWSRYSTFWKIQQGKLCNKSKTGQDFIGLAIWNDHREIIKIILDELEEPISHEMVKKVLKCGSPELVKMFLSKEKDLQPCEYFFKYRVGAMGATAS